MRLQAYAEILRPNAGSLWVMRWRILAICGRVVKNVNLIGGCDAEETVVDLLLGSHHDWFSRI